MITIVDGLLSSLKKIPTAFISFIVARPRVDIDIRLNPEGLYGQKALSVAGKQEYPIPAVPDVKWDFQFYWNYIITVRNNSSKTAYNLKIEKIHKSINDYLEPIDAITSLQDGESLDRKYIIRKNETLNGREADKFRQVFPPFLDQLEVIVSYTNEARIKFYTRFVMNDKIRKNQHLIFKPKT